MVYYTEKRVHPQHPSDLKVRYDRPGWLRCEQFGAGMITGWGAHHIDIAHWGIYQGRLYAWTLPAASQPEIRAETKVRLEIDAPVVFWSVDTPR
jgi:hypothetical protein